MEFFKRFFRKIKEFFTGKKEHEETINVYPTEEPETVKEESPVVEEVIEKAPEVETIEEAPIEEMTPTVNPEPEASFDYEAYFNAMTRDELYQFLKMNEVVGVSRYKKEQLLPLAIEVAKEKGLSK